MNEFKDKSKQDLEVYKRKIDISFTTRLSAWIVSTKSLPKDPNFFDKSTPTSSCQTSVFLRENVNYFSQEEFYHFSHRTVPNATPPSFRISAAIRSVCSRSSEWQHGSGVFLQGNRNGGQWGKINSEIVCLNIIYFCTRTRKKNSTKFLS